MNFIKKIVDGQIDGWVHIQFQKFSKGNFKNKAIVEAKNSKGNFTIKTSSEFANELVKIVAEKLGEDTTKIIGAIVSTSDLKGKIEFKEIKQFQGVKRYFIDKEMSGEEVLSLISEFPKAFFALTFEAKNCKLKIKPKAPKSGKPGKGNEAPKADFCVLKTSDVEIVKSFIFEKQDFKDAKINHGFVIENIEIPAELKNSDDFALIREKSLRVGKIIRNAEIDGVKTSKEYEFRA